MASWVKHTDAKSGNSYDCYVTEQGKSYIRHYLIDFGTTLGSAAHSPMPPFISHENMIDPNEMMENLITLGLNVKAHEKKVPLLFPSVGVFESKSFHPGKFKPHQPNPAFENCTNRDGFWGAKLVMSFSDDQLKVIVDQAQYSDDEARAYVLKILKERRDKIGRYWFDRINPLDRFKIVQKEDGLSALTFVDLAVKYQLEESEITNYHYDLSLNGKNIIQNHNTGGATEIPLPDEEKKEQYLQYLSGNPDNIDWEVKIRTYRKSKSVSKWVKIFLRGRVSDSSFHLLGIQREE
jgi:hypothetical protein